MAPFPGSSSASEGGKDPDYSIYEPLGKTSETTRTLFRELKTLVESWGNVRTDVFPSEMSFKYVAAPGNKKPVVAYVNVRIRNGLRVLIREKYVRDMPFEDRFTRPCHNGTFREINIRDREDIRKAEPLLRAAYDNLCGSRDHTESP